MARTFGRRAAGHARRTTDWKFATGVPTGLISIADGVQASLGSVAISEGGSTPGTIVRIRGNLHIVLATETAASVLILWGAGVGLFDDRALAASPGAGAGLPEPIDDADDEKWMWIDYGFIGNGPNLAGAPEVESEGTGRKIVFDIPIDSKAKRKWDENQTLVWLGENQLVDGAATEIDAAVMARMLIMPP